MSQTTTKKPLEVAVIGDSVAQVPAEVAQQLGITIIPLIVQIEGTPYQDGVDLAPSELYRRMRSENIMPTTTAPSVGKYYETFRDKLEAGAPAILCITLSSKLSMAYGTACQAAELIRGNFPDRQIEVFDTRQAAISQGFITIAAARAAAEGKSMPEVIQAAEDAKKHTGIAATVETLDYLARGGRIGKAAYMAGSLIKIKPILFVDEEGMVAPLSRVRGDNRALQAIVDHVAHQTNGYKTLYLAVMEADAQDQAQQLEELALQVLHPKEIFHSEFTPVMGVHTGPGLVGLGYYFD